MVSVGCLVNVISDLLKAPEQAANTFQDELNNWVLSGLLLNLLGKVNKDDSDESNKSDEESSNSNGAWVLQEGAFN